MPRPLVIDISKTLPHRPRALSAAELPQVFGGCVAQGGYCTSVADCCQVYVPPGDYVLCYFYRSSRIVTGYCSKSSTVYGGG